MSYRNEQGHLRHASARVIDFRNKTGTIGIPNNRFLAVRELKIQGLRVPHYNRRADIVCFINSLPVVFFELKAVYKNIRLGFDGNLTDYMTEQVIPHAFYHNAFLVVSNGDGHGTARSPASGTILQSGNGMTKRTKARWRHKEDRCP